MCCADSESSVPLHHLPLSLRAGVACSLTRPQTRYGCLPWTQITICVTPCLPPLRGPFQVDPLGTALHSPAPSLARLECNHVPRQGQPIYTVQFPPRAGSSHNPARLRPSRPGHIPVTLTSGGHVPPIDSVLAAPRRDSYSTTRSRFISAWRTLWQDNAQLYKGPRLGPAGTPRYWAGTCTHTTQVLPPHCLDWCESHTLTLAVCILNPLYCIHDCCPQAGGGLRWVQLPLAAHHPVFASNTLAPELMTIPSRQHPKAQVQCHMFITI